MASSLAFKRLASSSSTRFFKPLNPAAVGSMIPSSFSSASVRSFKTTFNFLDDEGNVVFKASKCPDSDEIEGFDVRTNERFLKTSRGIERITSGEGYEIRQDSEALNLILKMYGFEKEDVKISVENGRFIIKAAKKSEDNEFCLGLDMPPPYVYNHDKMKAEMKNGVPEAGEGYQTCPWESGSRLISLFHGGDLNQIKLGIREEDMMHLALFWFITLFISCFNSECPWGN